MFRRGDLPLASFGAGLTHAWQWCVFYSFLIIPFNAISADWLHLIMMLWPALQMLSFLIISLLGERLANINTSCAVSGVLAVVGCIGTMLCELSFLQNAVNPLLPLLTGMCLVCAGVTVLRISWTQVLSCFDFRNVQFASSLFIAFGSAVFLISNMLPSLFARVATPAFPLVSYLLLRSFQRQAATQSLRNPTPTEGIAKPPFGALLFSLVAFGVANSYIRGLELSLFEGGVGMAAQLLFSSIVVLGLVLGFARSQKLIYSGATLAVVGGLMLIVFSETRAVGTMLIGAGFICMEVLVWTINAELLKIDRTHGVRAIARSWIAIYFGSTLGIIAGRLVSQEGLGQTTGIAVSFALVYAFVLALMLFLHANFLHIFDPAPETQQPANSLRLKSIAASMEYGLTRREEEITELLMQGLSAREIESSLVISQNTVKYHIKNIYRKLGVNSRRELEEAVLRCDESALGKEGDPEHVGEGAS